MTSLYREPDHLDEVAWGALELHDVFRIYRAADAETVALRGLDLRIEVGEFVAVFGPSGSGKSTMLRLAAGLERPSAGDVRAFGISLTQLDQRSLARFRASTVALVFQSGNLWPALTARENMELSLRLAGRKASVRSVLTEFGLGPATQRRAGRLSGGEQQRVAIAAAAARGARLILADEPTAELDEENETIVLDALRGLRANEGATVVVVTHSARVAEVSDRVVEIRDGRVA